MFLQVVKRILNATYALCTKPPFKNVAKYFINKLHINIGICISLCLCLNKWIVENGKWAGINISIRLQQNNSWKEIKVIYSDHCHIHSFFCYLTCLLVICLWWPTCNLHLILPMGIFYSFTLNNKSDGNHINSLN